jgi:hypothetical protein
MSSPASVVAVEGVAGPGQWTQDAAVGVPDAVVTVVRFKCLERRINSLFKILQAQLNKYVNKINGKVILVLV